MPRIEPIPWEDLTDEQRAMMEAGGESGAYTMTLPLQILAYADPRRALRRRRSPPQLPEPSPRRPPARAAPHPQRPAGWLRAVHGVAEERHHHRRRRGVPHQPRAATRPRRAGARARSSFLDLLSNDHWAIDDDVYRGLGEVFTTAEIVELGQNVRRHDRPAPVPAHPRPARRRTARHRVRPEAGGRAPGPRATKPSAAPRTRTNSRQQRAIPVC